MRTHQRDRRNLTPGQLALVMGRHYNRTKLSLKERAERGAAARVASPEKQEKPSPHGQADRLAELYGVGHDTIAKAGKFAAAVETLKAVDPEIPSLSSCNPGNGGKRSNSSNTCNAVSLGCGGSQRYRSYRCTQRASGPVRPEALP